MFLFKPLDIHISASLLLMVAEHNCVSFKREQVKCDEICHMSTELILTLREHNVLQMHEDITCLL